jgi:hypothetical protein
VKAIVVTMETVDPSRSAPRQSSPWLAAGTITSPHPTARLIERPLKTTARPSRSRCRRS